VHGVVFAFFVLESDDPSISRLKPIDTDASKSFYTQFWHVPRVNIRNLHRRLSLRARKDRTGGNRGA
jgi:hypothetical protein